MTSRRSGSSNDHCTLVVQNKPILVYFSSRTYFISYPTVKAAGDSFEVIEKPRRRPARALLPSLFYFTYLPIKSFEVLTYPLIQFYNENVIKNLKTV